jgi:hypothetical protein
MSITPSSVGGVSGRRTREVGIWYRRRNIPGRMTVTGTYIAPVSTDKICGRRRAHSRQVSPSSTLA